MGFAIVYALANNPEVQNKARAEVDAVVGSHRLPTFADRPALPYVEAILKEAFRWFTIVPLGTLFPFLGLAQPLIDVSGIPHHSTEDHEYDGYFIPKGTVIMYNSWYVRVYQCDLHI